MKKLFLILVVFSLSFIGCPGPHDSADLPVTNNPFIGTWSTNIGSTIFWIFKFDNTNFTITSFNPKYDAYGTYTYTDTTITFHDGVFDPPYAVYNTTWTMDYVITETERGTRLTISTGNHEVGGRIGAADMDKVEE